MVYIAFEQVKKDLKKGIYITNIKYPIQSNMKKLICEPVPNSIKWRYVKSKKEFIPEGLA